MTIEELYLLLKDLDEEIASEQRVIQRLEKARRVLRSEFKHKCLKERCFKCKNSTGSGSHRTYCLLWNRPLQNLDVASCHEFRVEDR